MLRLDAVLSYWFKNVANTSGLHQNPENKNVSASEEEKETKTTTKVMRQCYDSKKLILHVLSKGDKICAME